MTLWAGSVWADAPDALPDPAQEARAVALGNELRCVVCEAQTINGSDASMARDMRVLIRDKIAQRWSDAQIRDFMRARYGDFILLRPPFQPNTWVLWFAPFLGLTAAGVGVGLVLRRRGGKKHKAVDRF